MARTERRITQIGNSLGLTLPNEILKSLNVKKGDEVQVELVGNQVIIKKSHLASAFAFHQFSHFFELFLSE